MTLDEAIDHARSKAECGGECAAEHAQLAEWLEELRVLREGRTCEMEYVSDFMSWHCKACDMMDMAPRNPKPRFCKWCGKKVVEE